MPWLATTVNRLDLHARAKTARRKVEDEVGVPRICQAQQVLDSKHAM
jgi:hypothetical protein